MNFNFVFLAIGLITITGTLISLRREHIRAEYSISWLLVGVLLSGVALFPGVLERGARALGVEPPICFLIVAGVLVSALIFEVSHVVSKLRDENVELAQRVAILEFRIRTSNAENGLRIS